MYLYLAIMDNIQTYQPSPTPKNIPIELLIDYSNKNLSYSEIAKLAGCSKTNVIQRFQHIDFTPHRVKAFKDNRADLFALMQARILNSVTDEDIQKAPLNLKVVSAGILYDKERIERGQAGQILGFEGLPDSGLSQAISGLLSKAERVGIRLTDIVGELPSQLRDSIGNLLPSSLPGADVSEDNLPVSVSSKHD